MNLLLSQFQREAQKWIPLNNNTSSVFKEYISKLSPSDIKSIQKLKQDAFSNKNQGEYSFQLPDNKHISINFGPYGVKDFKIGDGKAPAPNVKPNPQPTQAPNPQLSDISKAPASSALPKPEAPKPTPAAPVAPVSTPAPKVEKPPVVKEPSTKPKKKDSGWFSVYDEDAKGKYVEVLHKLSPDQRAKLKQLTESHVPNQHEVFDLHDGSGVFEFKTDKKGNIDSFRVTNKPPVKDHPAPVKQKMHEDTLHVPFSVPQNIQNEFNKPDYSKMPLNEENPVEMNQPAQPKEEEPLDAQPLYDVPFEKPNHNYTNVNNFSPEPKKEEEPDYSNPELDKQKKDNTGGIDAVKQEFNHAMEALTQHYLQLNRLNSSMQNIARQLTQSNNVTEAYNVQKLISAYEAMVSDVFKVSSQYMNIANQKHFNLQAVNPGLENIKAISNTSLQYLNQMINDIQQITKDAKLLHKVTNDPQMNMLWMMGNSSVNLLQRHYENLLQIVNDPTTWQDTSAVGKATNWLGNQWTNLKNRFK